MSPRVLVLLVGLSAPAFAQVFTGETVDDFVAFCGDGAIALKAASCGNYIAGSVDQLALSKGSTTCYSALSVAGKTLPNEMLFRLFSMSKAGAGKAQIWRAVRESLWASVPECK